MPELFKKKYGLQAGNVVGVGSFMPSYQSPDHATGLSPDVTPFWMVGATGVEVAVDTETGRITVTKLVNVADVGTPVNPRIVDTQLSGGAIMQLGFTMTEKMDFNEAYLGPEELRGYMQSEFARFTEVAKREKIEIK